MRPFSLLKWVKLSVNLSQIDLLLVIFTILIVFAILFLLAFISLIQEGSYSKAQ